MPQQITLFDSYLKQNVTLTGETTVKKDTIKLYSCGPTVYNYQTIGNMRAAWLPDTIAKVAKLAGWEVEWTLNITDVGHLVSDGDEGEDKIEKGAKRDGKTVNQIVNYYTNDYRNQCQALNFDLPEGFYNPKATDYFKEQMILALELMDKGLAYLTDDGIYYDTLAVATIKQADLSPTARYFLEKSQSIKKTGQFTDRAILETDKHHSDDFALWKFVSEKNLQKWKFNEVEETERLMISILQTLDTKDFDLPNRWGTPGWHSECVCMICGTLNGHFPPQLQETKLPLTRGLGGNAVIDIHTGGEDHIDIHHRNEILQSEALGFKLSQYWVHNKFVMVDGGKMSKSLGNVYLVTGKHENTGFYSLTNPPQEVSDRLQSKYQVSGFDPLAYRLMLMEHHYTEQMNFTWEKLEQSQVRLWNLRKEAAKLSSYRHYLSGEKITRLSNWREEFGAEKFDQLYEVTKGDLLALGRDNLNLPKLIDKYQQLLTEMNQGKSLDWIQSLNSHKDYLYYVLAEFDQELLKLSLFDTERSNLDLKYKEIYKLSDSRQHSKEVKNWTEADKIRDQIAALGWQVDDYAWGWGVWVRNGYLPNKQVV